MITNARIQTSGGAALKVCFFVSGGGGGWGMFERLTSVQWLLPTNMHRAWIAKNKTLIILHKISTPILAVFVIITWNLVDAADSFSFLPHHVLSMSTDGCGFTKELPSGRGTRRRGFSRCRLANSHLLTGASLAMASVPACLTAFGLLCVHHSVGPDITCHLNTVGHTQNAGPLR